MPTLRPEIPHNPGASVKSKQDALALSRRASNSALPPLFVHLAQCKRLLSPSRFGKWTL
ncbi:hypothetical protein GBAR_LOCUS14850, partial [Geodia barretti]